MVVGQPAVQNIVKSCDMARNIREDGRAFEIKNIQIVPTYENPDYRLVFVPETVMSTSGEWSIFRLEHADGSWFNARWDEQQSAVDIDFFKTREARKPFKDFPGHWTHQPHPHVRSYDVDISLDSTRIFAGHVRFLLTRRICQTATARIVAVVKPTLRQKFSFRFIWSKIREWWITRQALRNLAKLP